MARGLQAKALVVGSLVNGWSQREIWSAVECQTAPTSMSKSDAKAANGSPLQAAVARQVAHVRGPAQAQRAGMALGQHWGQAYRQCEFSHRMHVLCVRDEAHGSPRSRTQRPEAHRSDDRL